MKPEERFTGVHHGAFATSDLKYTMRFWHDVLGLPVCVDVGEGEERQIFFGLGPASFISFFVWPGVQAMPRKTPGRAVRGRFTFDHISIGVRSAKDLVRLQSSLEEAGFPVSDVIDHGFLHSIYTFDPNGIPVEFSLPRDDVFSRPFLSSVESREEEVGDSLRDRAAGDDLDASAGDEGDYHLIPGAGRDSFKERQKRGPFGGGRQMGDRNVEIERKFRVKSLEYRALARPDFIAQGYLNSDKHRTVRVRIQDDMASLAIKSLTEGISRTEYEYSIPLEEAREILDHLCEKPIIEKNRYTLRVHGQTWEVDEFLGANEGLVVAEVELSDPDSQLVLPPWVGEEVSDDPRYFNSNLVSHPFSQWGAADRKEIV